MLTWTLTLHCHTCGAAIIYTDERPPWKVERPNRQAVARARAWIAERPECPNNTLFSACPDRPLYARCPTFFGTRHSLEIPEPRHYVLCPACDGRVYRESGLLSAAPEPVSEPVEAGG